MDHLGIVIARVENLPRVRELGLEQAEFILFRQENRHRLEEYIRTERIRFGLHSPIFRPSTDWYDGHPLSLCMLDHDEDRVRMAFELMEATFRTAQEWGASYVTVHLQRPALFLRDEIPPSFEAQARDVLFRSCERLTRLSEQYGVPVFGENMIAHPHLCQIEHYVELFERFPTIGFCMDFGHAIIDAIKYGFSLREFVAALAPFTKDIHLYNNILDEEFEFFELKDKGLLRKVPVHPKQDVAQGWIDIPWVLDTVLTASPDCWINFEVYLSMETDPVETREGIEWVRGLLRGRERDNQRPTSNVQRPTFNG